MNQLQGVRHTFLKLTRNLLAGAVVLALGLALGTTKVQAATDTWIANSGDFNNPGNWDTAPVGGDNVVFTNNNSYTLSFNAFSPVLQNITFSGHVGVVTLNMGANVLYATNSFRVGRFDATQTVSMVSGVLYVSDGGVSQIRIGDSATNSPPVSAMGTMFVSGGTVYADAVSIGASTNSVGALVISGPTTLWTYDDMTYVNGGGALGNGTLTVGDGAANSSLVVSNGATLFIHGNIIVGNNADGSNNFMLVTGPSTSVSNTFGNGLRIGNGGNNNTLIISNGAILYTDNGGTFGSGCNGNKVIVTGPGSRLIGGILSNKNMIIGPNSGGSTNNDLTVTDGGFLFSGGSLSFGNNIGSGNTFHMGGSGAMSTGFAGVVRNASTTTFGAMFVTNALMRCSQLTLQGISNNLTVLQNGAVILTNQYAVTASLTNVVSLNSQFGTHTINGGTLSAVTGTNAMALTMGGTNTLVIMNGGKLLTELATLGNNGAYATGLVSGVGTVWSNWTVTVNHTNSLTVGAGASNGKCFLGILDGASLFNNGTFNIGANVTSQFNTVNFGGPGALVTVVNGGSLNIGSTSNSNGQVVNITNATVTTVNLNVGNSGATNNTLVLKGGSLSVGFMRVRPTNSVIFAGGVMSAGGSTVDTLADNNGPFVVGDGTTASAAVYEMAAGGTGYHNFNNGGLVVTNGATLRGTGTIVGNATVLGTFSPGIGGVGWIYASNDLVFGSAAVLNYDLGTVAVSDTATVNGNLTLGGTINVTSAPGFGANTYTLFTHTNLVSGPAGTLTVGTMPGGFTATVATNTLPLVQLIVTASGGSDPFTAWQAQYFTGSPLSSAPGADPLGKGISNTNQFLAGFNPTNAAAYPHITAVTKTNGGTDIRVDYLGASGNSLTTPAMASRTNVLEFTAGNGGNYNSNNFASTGQTNILSGGIGLGTLTNMVDPGGATAGATRYYRVRVLVP